MKPYSETSDVTARIAVLINTNLYDNMLLQNTINYHSSLIHIVDIEFFFILGLPTKLLKSRFKYVPKYILTYAITVIDQKKFSKDIGT